MLKIVKESKYNNCFSTAEYKFQSLDECFNKFEELIDKEQSYFKPISDWVISRDSIQFNAHNINNPEEQYYHIHIEFDVVNTVCLVIIDRHNDCGTNNQYKVFRNIDSAKRYMKSIIDDNINYIKELGWIIEDEQELSFSAYEEGNYCSNHLEIYILTLPIH